MNGAVFLFTRAARCLTGQRVLEVGSRDVNGSPRENFERAGEYIGIDFIEGKGVDRVMNAEDLAAVFPAEHFDRVLLCESLEHCENWKEVLNASWWVLKVGGLACVTTPTKDKLRHNYPNDYWRWTLEDYQEMFGQQQIRKLEKVGKAGIGIIVQKVNNDLRLDDIQPFKVP
jgi:ubiquinone/menaquinone biosynthesis C-methylase UbiE